nr:unnamed protein product [Callosobruchus analis]
MFHYLYLDENIIRTIVVCTNMYIDKVRAKYDRQRDAKQTNEMEIRALFGILLQIGVLRSSRQDAHQMWDNSKGSGIELCYLAMSEKRFYFLLRCLRFDNINDRSQRTKTDKMEHIRDVFQLFIGNFQKNFIASEYLTVKPARYGIKMSALVDAKSGYTFNLETYVGTQPEGPFRLGNSAQEIVLRMVEPIKNSNRNVTGDNWFTSVSLVNKLLEKKLTYVGIFGFQENCTLVSYCPRKNKTVLVISSMHHDHSIDIETAEKAKPEIITCYNKTKIGVDLLDQKCQKYNVARNTRRWPMVIFYDLLNISVVNAFCVYKANNGFPRIKRKNFIESLAWELVKPQIEHRSNIPQLPVEIRRRARVLLGVPEPEILSHPVQENSVGRCYICTRNRNKSTRRYCVQCHRYACKEHMRDVCLNCV